MDFLMTTQPINARGNARNEPEEDRQYLERIARGDRQAMQKLYFAYHRRLNRFLLRTLSPERADEIINDTMFVVWRHAADFRGESRVSTWILGIAYRLALKRLKRDQPRDFSTVELSDANEAALMDDAGAQQRETREWIDRALLALPPAQRLTVELAYFLGHSCEEIAVITDCPVNTVKTRLFHARERLRRSLPVLSDATPASGSGTTT
jgi:RNA polymerase sigma-70 factor (ECF subfamily)